ncbi:MAG: DUF4330 domain-containing protein [Clostridiales bacterium]|jgi:hypothetical protein|nr:DUF4330 domain-containing protein [Clostridiales bacterium]
MFIDKKYRLFGLVSIVDIGMAAVFVLFVFLALRLSAPQVASAKPGDVKIKYTVEIQKKLPNFKESIHEGADVYDSQKGYLIGKILGVSTMPYLEDVGDIDAEIIRRAPIPGFEAVYVQIEATAQITDMTTAVGAFEILVGKEVYIKNKDFAAFGYIVAVEKE